MCQVWLCLEKLNALFRPGPYSQSCLTDRKQLPRSIRFVSVSQQTLSIYLYNSSFPLLCKASSVLGNEQIPLWLPSPTALFIHGNSKVFTANSDR